MDLAWAWALPDFAAAVVVGFCSFVFAEVEMLMFFGENEHFCWGATERGAAVVPRLAPETDPFRTVARPEELPAELVVAALVPEVLKELFAAPLPLADPEEL